MGNKQVVSRERATGTVVQGVKQFGEPIVEALHALLVSELREGERPPDFTLVPTLIARVLERNIANLVVAHEANEREAADDDEPRRRRDALEEAIRLHVSSLRQSVGGVYGPAGLRVFGASKPMQSGPAPALAYGRQVGQLLRTATPPPPLEEAAGMTFDPLAAADRLVPLTEQLDLAIKDVAREKVELVETTLARTAALEANDKAFVVLAGLVESMARAAGKTEFADRIRPSTHQAGLLATEPDEPAQPEETTVPTTTTTPTATKAKVTDPGLPGADPFDP